MSAENEKFLSFRAQAHPSLALIKYWGKAERGINIPAVPSLAVTLDSILTTTDITLSRDDKHHILLDTTEQPLERFQPFLRAAAEHFGTLPPLFIKSTNNFPTAAGLASSSSGFAALAVGLNAFFKSVLSDAQLSALARVGSGSASRSIFGGFTAFRDGSETAEQLYPESFWPELRVVICIVTGKRKKTASRSAMNLTRKTSPYYPAWVQNSRQVFSEALDALKVKDIEKLGECMRLSYLRMFATMFSASPPITYWAPKSVALQQLAASLRDNGVPVWETMDAGPQIKLFTLQNHTDSVLNAIQSKFPEIQTMTASPGPAPSVQALQPDA